MSDYRIASAFAGARDHIEQAVTLLLALRRTYAHSSLPQTVRLARLAAIDAKVDYLLGLGLDSEAHPWVEDSP